MFFSIVCALKNLLWLLFDHFISCPTIEIPATVDTLGPAAFINGHKLTLLNLTTRCYPLVYFVDFSWLSFLV